MSWLDKLEISFEHNDLLSINVEAIVCPVRLSLDAYGKISQRIFTAGRDALRDEVFTIKEYLPDNKLLLGQAISIVCKPDYHIGNFRRLIFTALWDHHSEYNVNLFYKAYINSLRDAFQHHIKSIALPVMAYDGNLSLCGKAIIKVIQDLDSMKNSSEFSVENIYFVSNNREHINYLVKEVEPKLP